jgi:hypothetical protein
MIQRIQSLYLLIAAGLGFLLFIMPVWVMHTGASGNTIYFYTYKLMAISAEHGTKEIQIDYLPLVLNVLILLFSLISIFLYKKRLLQYQFCRFTILLDAGFIAALVFAYDDAKKLYLKEGVDSFFQLPVVFPVLILLFVYLAARAIMKDEKMLRAADRLR